MELEQLKNEVESLRAALAEAKQSENDEPKKSDVETRTSTIKPIYIAPGRRLETFQGRPNHPSDQSVYDWILGSQDTAGTQRVGREGGGNLHQRAPGWRC